MMPLVMPKVSCSTLTTGARQLVVQEALEITLCFAASYLFSLTPRTMVMSSLLAGAEMRLPRPSRAWRDRARRRP